MWRAATVNGNWLEAGARVTRLVSRNWHRSVAFAGWGRDLLLPERCPSCMVVHDGGFCHSCHELLPWITVACETCRVALGLPGTCSECLKHPPPWDSMVAPFHYSDPISGMIQQLKYNRRLYLVRALSESLAERVLRHRDPLPDTLLPMPLHPSRTRQRGFNQAALIARETGRLLGIPVDSSLLKRSRATLTQTKLSAAERTKNLQDAFAVEASERYDAVAVIDDVVTSGATMGSACQVLRLQGYSRISAWAIARA